MAPPSTFLSFKKQTPARLWVIGAKAEQATFREFVEYSRAVNGEDQLKAVLVVQDGESAAA